MGDGDRNVRRIHYLDLHSDIDLYDVLGGPTMKCRMCGEELRTDVDIRTKYGYCSLLCYVKFHKDDDE